MEYPKIVKLENEKLKKLISTKGEIINEGRKLSERIELLEKDMEDIDKAIQAEESKVDIADFDEKAKAITERVNVCIAEMNEVKKGVYERMIAQTDVKLREKYEETKKLKEEIEEERNKVAIKAQKYNDKIIPLSKKAATPFLTEKGDDIETISIQDGWLMLTVFNHYDDFNKQYEKKLTK